MVTQQRREAPHFGPTWPEVAGFGAAGPNKQSMVLPQGKIIDVQVNVNTLALLAVLRKATKLCKSKAFFFSVQSYYRVLLWQKGFQTGFQIHLTKLV
jgi:hypothetical protein